MDMKQVPWWAELLAIAVVFLALIAVAAAVFNPQGTDVTRTAENVSGGMPHLAAGDTLVYRFEFGSSSRNVTVRALGMRGDCFALSQETSLANLTYCFPVAGEQRLLGGEEISGSVRDTRCLAFEPWMADARENWSARTLVATELRGGALGMTYREELETFLRAAGTENVSGRTALRVESRTVLRRQTSNGTHEELAEARTVWVDAQTRVALAQNGTYYLGNNAPYRGTLVSAPFAPANKTGEN